ncbi:MAG: YmdB family metallophosphoesterase, partial [Thiohalorhabdaceae bacterium]
MNILFVGDIFGKPGRRVLRDNIDSLKQELEADLVIV